jgi:DNA-binding response OmpR family regulator
MHILIVEDEVGIVQFLQHLEEEGYQVTSAFDGLQGRTYKKSIILI